jgi:hypothetical protein
MSLRMHGMTQQAVLVAARRDIGTTVADRRDNVCAERG